MWNIACPLCALHLHYTKDFQKNTKENIDNSDMSVLGHILFNFFLYHVWIPEILTVYLTPMLIYLSSSYVIWHACQICHKCDIWPLWHEFRMTYDDDKYVNMGVKRSVRILAIQPWYWKLLKLQLNDPKLTYRYYQYFSENPLYNVSVMRTVDKQYFTLVSTEVPPDIPHYLHESK